MESLSKKKCLPCTEGTPHLTALEIADLKKQIAADWKVVDQHHLEKTFSFDNFREAMRWTQAIGEIAEVEGHHPDIYLAWGICRVMIWTHKINGLSESDFILAAKIDALSCPQK